MFKEIISSINKIDWITNGTLFLFIFTFCSNYGLETQPKRIMY